MWTWPRFRLNNTISYSFSVSMITPFVLSFTVEIIQVDQLLSIGMSCSRWLQLRYVDILRVPPWQWRMIYSETFISCWWSWDRMRGSRWAIWETDINLCDCNYKHREYNTNRRMQSADADIVGLHHLHCKHKILKDNRLPSAPFDLKVLKYNVITRLLDSVSWVVTVADNSRI